MVWRWLLALLLLWGGGCERVDMASPGPARPETTSGPSLEELHRRVVVALAEAHQRLGMAAGEPSPRGSRRCADESIALLPPGAPNAAVVVRARDERLIPKHLIPLEVLARLESDEFRTVASLLTGGRAGLWDPEAARPHSVEAAGEALRELERLRNTRYVAEIQIVTYSAPKLFRRKGALRSEWHAGVLSFDLVVYDLEAGKLLCQTSGIARGDATGAPIRRALRERTRVELQRALADRTWLAASAALEQITRRLVFPDRARRSEPRFRWSTDRPQSSVPTPANRQPS